MEDTSPYDHGVHVAQIAVSLQKQNSMKLGFNVMSLDTVNRIIKDNLNQPIMV